MKTVKDYWCIQGVGQEWIKNCVRFPSSLDLDKKIQDLRNDFLLHNETKMMLLVSIATNNMIRYVSIYPEVWFLDCTAGE